MKTAYSIILVLNLFLVMNVFAFGQEPTKSIIPLNGLDPVSLINGKEFPGKEDFSEVRGRFKYLFASKSNLEKFKGSPDRYEIQRNGECCVMKGVKTNADIFKVYRGKIYTFGTLLCRERFNYSPESFINPGQRKDLKLRNVAILIYEGVELLDFAGPGEVFAAAQTIEGQRAFNVYTVAASADAIVSQGFVKVTPQYTIANCPPPDIIVLPGGTNNNVIRDNNVIDWIKNASRETEITMSVCNGAYFLVRAGLLENNKATTHWTQIDKLKKEAPTTTVIENVRYIDNGKVITTAGVSAGTDGALHIVDRLLGRPAAQLTARYMEYDWREIKK